MRWNRYLPLLLVGVMLLTVSLVAFADETYLPLVLRGSGPGVPTPGQPATTPTAAVTATAVPSPTVAPRQPGERIAYECRTPAGWTGLCLVNADGTGFSVLTEPSSWSDRSPSWSPHGNRIAFESDRDPAPEPLGYQTELYVMNADGSGQTRLTDCLPSGVNGIECASLYDPAWSPDGTLIAFNDFRSIYVMNADGTDVRRLTSTSWGSPYATEPSWSPDGKWIAFCAISGNLSTIQVILADGAYRTPLTSLPPKGYGGGGTTGDDQPAWSPDGEYIAFHSDERDLGDNIYIMKADGTDIRWLTRGANPSWSPDGLRIAYDSACGAYVCTKHVYVIGADGRNETKLVPGSNPAWSPR